MERFLTLEGMFLANLARYVLWAGMAFGIFYVWKARRFWRLKIQQKMPGRADYRREAGWSLLSLLIFSGVGWTVVSTAEQPWNLLYLDIDAHSRTWLWLSVPLLVLWHDTWFYWTHRLMHWRKIFRHVHRVHHQSTNPSPWAAFAFHPTEAVIEAAVLPVAVLFMPLHPVAVAVWLTYMTVLNVVGHLGFEIFPRGFTRAKISGWHNTSTHHNMHHQFFNCNYGLYFNFWDRLMGTNHARYHETFEAVKSRTENGEILG